MQTYPAFTLQNIGFTIYQFLEQEQIFKLYDGDNNLVNPATYGPSGGSITPYFRIMTDNLLDMTRPQFHQFQCDVLPDAARLTLTADQTRTIPLGVHRAFIFAMPADGIFKVIAAGQINVLAGGGYGNLSP